MMRIRILASWLVCALLASSAFAQGFTMPPGTGAIAGKVVASDTGKPIRRAIVQIVIFGNLSGRFGSAVTDDEGKYELKNLPAGQYRISASATRYIQMEYGAAAPGPIGLNNQSRAIELKDGERFGTADFSLIGFGAIEGTVVDEFGDPVPNVAIAVEQVAFGGGRKRLMPANVTALAGPIKPTDDNGHFRVGGLPPGDYYVAALSGAFADPSAAGGFAITFLPGTTRASAAAAVKLEPGRDVVGLSFPLTPTTMTTLTGKLIDDNGDPVKGGNMMLMPSETTGATLFLQSRTAADDHGEFTFRNVPAGTYTIQAYGRQVGTGGNLNAFAFGYLTFTVDGRRNDPLTVRVPAPRTLRGRISFEGDPLQIPKPDEVRVNPAPVDFESAPIAGGPSPSTVNADWTFEVKAMSGLRMINAVTRGTWIVKRITMAGQDVTDTPVDLREHDVNDVEIVMTQRASTVTGTITGADDKPLAGYNIVIYSTDDTKWGIWSRYVTYTRSGPNGQFAARGLPPGTYVAVAVPALMTGEWQDPQFLERQLTNPSAQRFTLAEGGAAAVTMKIR